MVVSRNFSGIEAPRRITNNIETFESPSARSDGHTSQAVAIMTDRALLVGINDYPTSPLRGCINDVVDVAELLVGKLGFARDGIELLTERRATKDAILEALRSLVQRSRPGDRALFHFSGHGTQLLSYDADGEADGLDEAICPVDFTWYDDRSGIRDKDFRRIFAEIQPGVTFVWVSDSCHSGDLTRAMRRPGELARHLPPPPDIAWQMDSLRLRDAHRMRTFRGVAEPLRLAFLSGCASDQTAADAMFDSRPNGALSYFLLRELRSDGGLARSFAAAVDLVTHTLAGNGFSQRPTVEGVPALLGLPFLAPEPLSVSAAPPWQAVFEEIDRRVTADRSLERQILAHTAMFTTEVSRVLQLDLGHAITPTAAASQRGGTVVRAFWWGFHVEISHQDLATFLGAAIPVNSIAAAIGPVTGPAAPFVALVAGVIAATLEALRGLDRGRGVYVSMSWFAPGVFVPTSV